MKEKVKVKEPITLRLDDACEKIVENVMSEFGFSRSQALRYIVRSFIRQQ